MTDKNSIGEKCGLEFKDFVEPVGIKEGDPIEAWFTK
jgi:hypothetical protein